MSLSGQWTLSDKIYLKFSTPSSQGIFLFGILSLDTVLFFLGSILSQPVPVPGRDKIIPKKRKAHNNKKGKQRNPKKEQRSTEKEERKQKQKSKKARTRKTKRKEERTRKGKEGNPRISNLSKIESNFGNSSYVESVIVKTGILKIKDRGTKTMDPLN